MIDLSQGIQRNLYLFLEYNFFMTETSGQNQKSPASTRPMPEGFALIPFGDGSNAASIMKRLESKYEAGMKDVSNWLITGLANAVDPDRSLIHFERLADATGESLFDILSDNPRLIEILITLFSTSAFLTEILLGTPDGIELISQRNLLTEKKTVEQFQSEAITAFQQHENHHEKLDALRRYQRRQLLRIGVSDFLDLFDLRTVFAQVSRMAIGLVRACLALAVEQTGISASGFSVLAMGKLGARELNYSSDIDLLFVCRGEAEKYYDLGKALIENISMSTSKGFLYRVDMRLRPWGHEGALVTSKEGYLRYFTDSALMWEKQAFLKARPIAGNLGLGEELRNEIKPMLYSIPPDEVRAGIFSMKQRTEEFLAEKGRDWGEVKLGEGSIRDVEFVVQALQLTHPSIRTRATLKAIPLLRDDQLLTSVEARTLTEGYVFLRTIEHYLQITNYQQIYSLPTDKNSLNLLARRLGFEGGGAADRFVDAYEKHCQAIRAIFLKYVGNQSNPKASVSMESNRQVAQHVARMDASYSDTFNAQEINLHTRLTESLSHEKPVLVDTNALDGFRWCVTIVGYDYLGILSLISGLLFLYDLNILESQIFTYESNGGDIENGVKKFVDVFVVSPLHNDDLNNQFWQAYSDDLLGLMRKLQTGKRREAQVDLAKRVGARFQATPADGMPLYPMEIEIDNEADEKYTVLRIGAPDTAGFLYEFSNALALSHINVVRMQVQTVGNRACDVLYVHDDRGEKILSAQKQRELRAATVLIKHFTHLLPHSPNPESAMLHFREFLYQLFKRPNWVDEFARIERPEVLNALARLLGVSDFLWDDFLRMQYSNLFPIVSDVSTLEAAPTKKQMKRELDKILSTSKDWRESVNEFKDREMFRIDMRHILGHSAEFGEFSAELTDLVELVIETAYHHCRQEMIEKYGVPRLEDGKECCASMLALGKCGGRELGFASDIELMFIYAGQGETSGAKKVANSVFHEELMHSFILSIKARQEGVFHIDLQLRPYGKAGSQAVALDAFTRYYAPGGQAWPYERQALVKLRPICGDEKLGKQLSDLRDQYVYHGEEFDVTAMRAMRERQERHLVQAGTFNAKFSPGALVDIEYLVQGLQINYGAKDPTLRQTNIREAMAALHKSGYLSDDEYDRLRKAHTFTRWLIDSLRVVRGNAKDITIPPFDSEEFAYLARRLRYGSDVERLVQDLSRYAQDVQELNLRLLPAK